MRVAPAWLARAADGLLAVLLAPPCAACERPLDHPTRSVVCDSCWQAIVPFRPPVCARCGDPLPSWRVISIDAGLCPRCRRTSGRVSCAGAIGAYDGPLRAIVHALKYDRRRSLARPVAGLIRAHAGAILDGADVVVPVPLHRARRRARGFNQAAEIARFLDPPCLDALQRPRRTPSQTDLPAARRHANVRGAFRLRPGVDVRSLCVVLVDDVSTTGATLEACAEVLMAAGAREVRAVTAARVVSRRP